MGIVVSASKSQMATRQKSIPRNSGNTMQVSSEALQDSNEVEIINHHNDWVKDHRDFMYFVGILLFMVTLVVCRFACNAAPESKSDKEYVISFVDLEEVVLEQNQ